MKRLRPLTVLPLAFAATSLFAQEPASATDAIFGALRISSLEQLAASAGAFADQIQPGSAANTAQLPAMAGAFGFATDQEILALVIDPQKSAQPFALVLPALDPEQLKANPAFNFQPVAGSTDRFQLTLPNGMPMFATFVGKRLVVSPLEAGLDAVLPAIKSDADIRQLRASGGQLALSLSADRLYAAYKPVLDFALMGMRSQFAKASSATPKAPNPADMFGSLLGTLGEVQDYSLSISLQAEHVDLRSSIVAKPGTQTAALLSAGRGPAVVPAAYDESSAVFGTFSARPTPEFWAAYNRFVGDFLSSLGTPDAASSSATLTKVTNDFAAIWDGTGTMAMFSPNQTMSGTGSIGIKDQDKALALLRTLPELQKSMEPLNAAQGLATEAVIGAEETYGDARLLDLTQTYRATTPETEEAFARLKKIGMDKFTATYGVAPTRIVYAMGADTRAETKRLLDAPASASTTITPAAFGLPAESTAFVAISLPRYLGWMSRVAEGMPFSFDATAAPQKPGLAMTTDLVDGRADFRLRVLTAEIIAVKNAFTPPTTAAAPAPTVIE